MMEAFGTTAWCSRFRDNDDVNDDNNAETKLELQCLFSLSIVSIFTSYPCKVELVSLFPGVLTCIQVTLEESGNPLATVSAFGINDEECQVRLPDCENMWNAKITKHTLCEGILSPATCAKMPRTNITSNLPQVGFCAVCQVEASVRRVTVRGLCELSMFDRFVQISSSSVGLKVFVL